MGIQDVGPQGCPTDSLCDLEQVCPLSGSQFPCPGGLDPKPPLGLLLSLLGHKWAGRMRSEREAVTQMKAILSSFLLAEYSQSTMLCTVGIWGV